MKKTFCIQKSLGFLILALGSGFAIVSYGTHALATTPLSATIDTTSKISSANPEEVERFLGLDKVEAFSHQRIPLEPDVDKSSLDFVDLKLTDAIDLTIKTHLQSREARERIEESLGRRWQSMSPLLPHLDATVSQART